MVSASSLKLQFPKMNKTIIWRLVLSVSFDVMNMELYIDRAPKLRRIEGP